MPKDWFGFLAAHILFTRATFSRSHSVDWAKVLPFRPLDVARRLLTGNLDLFLAVVFTGQQFAITPYQA